MITFGILMAVGLEGVILHFQGEDIQYPWYIPLSAVIAGIVCSLPSLLLVNIFEKKRSTLIIRIVIHSICLYGIVMGMGYLFKWYNSKMGFIYVSISFLLVYIFVWLGSLFLNKQEDKKINEALEAIRDEE